MAGTTVFFAENLPEQRVINISVSNHVYNMDPMTAAYTAEAELFTGLYEGLFSYDPANLNPIPAICTSYKISRDKKRWTFNLRQNAAFSDGTPIKAQDVKDSWITLLSTKNAPFASLIDSITGAQEFREGRLAADKVLTIGEFTDDANAEEKQIKQELDFNIEQVKSKVKQTAKAVNLSMLAGDKE